jgi:ATP-dependent helicase Lhr and Lhr-like helicase
LAKTHLEAFSEPVAQWFDACFDDPTPAQVRAWPVIQSGQSALLVAPTGSGKTLAAFLAALDRLFFEPAEQAGVRVLYISPLKALGVDVERNLRAPHQGIRAIAEQSQLATQPVNIGVRSGDTSQKERQAMVRNPPEILITTPESLYLLLTSKARQILKTVDTAIIDEIHAVAPSKRGSRCCH